MILLLLDVTSYGAVADLLGTAKTAKAEGVESDVNTEITKNSDKYKTRDAFYSLSDSSVNCVTSEHFQIIWRNKDTTGTVNRAFVEGNWPTSKVSVHFAYDKFRSKDIGTSPNRGITGKYKTNI